MMCLILTKSLTMAKRTERLLLQYGIPVRVVRPSQELSDRGCGYAVRVDRAYLPNAVHLLQGNGLPVRRVFGMTPSGSYQEIQI